MTLADLDEILTSDQFVAFHVDGKNIPQVPFDAGDSWAGLLPISGNPSETRKLFFWLWPTLKDVGNDDLVIWLNGVCPMTVRFSDLV